MTTLPPLWLEARLDRLREARVAVFGDVCLDAYWLVDADESERSIETGRAVWRVRAQHYSAGGAGNVAVNLAALGVGRVRVVGLVGDDLFGRQLRERLVACGADVEGLLACQDDWQTLVYAKPCRGDEEQDRIDFGAFNALAPASMEALAEALGRAAAESDFVILNQQAPAGASPPAMIERLNALIAAPPRCRFLVDSRHRAEFYRGAMLKLNTAEAARLCGRRLAPNERLADADVRDLAARLFERTRQPVFITRGEHGMVAADANGVISAPGIPVAGPVDAVGAGDTAVAALAAALGSGGDLHAAVALANLAAAVTVAKLQITGAATPDEIRRVARRGN